MVIRGAESVNEQDLVRQKFQRVRLLGRIFRRRNEGEEEQGIKGNLCKGSLLGPSPPLNIPFLPVVKKLYFIVRGSGTNSPFSPSLPVFPLQIVGLSTYFGIFLVRHSRKVISTWSLNIDVHNLPRKILDS